MNQQYNFYNIEASFSTFLSTGNKTIRPVSIKNYISDLRHFMGWAVSKAQSEQTPPSNDEVTFIQTLGSEGTIRAYLEDLRTNTVPSATINRRLSTLNKFFFFAHQQGWVAINPFKHAQFRREISGEDLLKDFAIYLQNDSEKDQVMTDIRGFIEFSKNA